MTSTVSAITIVLSVSAIFISAFGLGRLRAMKEQIDFLIKEIERRKNQ